MLSRKQRRQRRQRKQLQDCLRRLERSALYATTSSAAYRKTFSSVMADISKAMGDLAVIPGPLGALGSARLGPIQDNPFSIGSGINAMGLKVIEAREYPAVQMQQRYLYNGDPVFSEGTLARMNAFLLGAFGTRSAVPKNSLLFMPSLGTVIARPDQMAVIRDLGA